MCKNMLFLVNPLNLSQASNSATVPNKKLNDQAVPSEFKVPTKFHHTDIQGLFSLTIPSISFYYLALFGNIIHVEWWDFFGF